MARTLRVEPRDRAAWRAWLAAHHATASQVVLVFRRKGTGPSVTYDEAVEEALCFGWIDGVKRTIDDQRYSHRFSPRKPHSRWSASNKRRVAALIAAGRMHPAGRAVLEAAKRSGAYARVSAADAPDSGAIPAELAAAFRRTRGARQAFEALAPGQQRLWRRWVAEARQAETRTRRAAKAVVQLVAGRKVPMG
jgi:uncharacterized protein YdeI (YjbR/CyaY-like superfamily)